MIRTLRLLLFAALLLAPLGRIGMAEAAGGTAVAASGHCREGPAPGSRAPAHEGVMIDCAIACAAIAALPTSFAAPPPACAETPPIAVRPSDLAGILPDAELPPPRFS
jgi:hypothetical protein